MRLRSRRLGAISVLVIGAAMCVGCSEQSDVDVLNEKLFATTPTNFKAQLLLKWEDLLDATPGVVGVLWDQGVTSVLDEPGGALKSYWFDVSTDFCSNSPDTGAWFDFKISCARHDFGWRNLQRLDRHWNCQAGPCSTGLLGRYWHVQNRHVVNSQFYRDMESHCSDRSWLIRGMCRDTRDAYFEAVEFASLHS